MAWQTLAAVLAAGALAGWLLPSPSIDWQPALAAREPWRAWTAAFVHWSPLHLGANLLGALVVGAFGRAGELPWRAALAWFAAWPMTHAALLLRPELAHYGGLSGVLHAGVAAAAVWLLLGGHGRTRAIGGLVLAGLALKVALEEPWGAPLRRPADWDIAIAPLAHATGAIAGALLALVLRRQSPR